MIWIAAALWGTAAIASLSAMEQWRRDQPSDDHHCHHEKR